MLKCEQKLLTSSFQEEITEVPAGCRGRGPHQDMEPAANGYPDSENQSDFDY